MQVMLNSKVSNGNHASEAKFETLMVRTHILDHYNGDMYQRGRLVIVVQFQSIPLKQNNPQ
jgi:hypothetical protein